MRKERLLFPISQHCSATTPGHISNRNVARALPNFVIMLPLFFFNLIMTVRPLWTALSMKGVWTDRHLKFQSFLSVLEHSLFVLWWLTPALSHTEHCCTVSGLRQPVFRNHGCFGICIHLDITGHHLVMHADGSGLAVSWLSNVEWEKKNGVLRKSFSVPLPIFLNRNLQCE